MAYLWGKDYARRDLESYVGDLRRIADITFATLADSFQCGTRVALVRTGSGLAFTVLLDRAMDIGMATFNGIPLTWQSGNGAVNPAYFEPTLAGWRRNFHGGLLLLCGLTQVGAAIPSFDPITGETLLTHGIISNTPAHDIRIERVWNDRDEWMLQLKGIVEENDMYGHRLRLERTIEIIPGQPIINVYDSVRNLRRQSTPFMILYHCNFGWPLISPGTEVTGPKWSFIVPDRQPLQAPVAQRVPPTLFHEIQATSSPATVTIRNAQLGLAVDLSFDPVTLKYLTQWNQLGFSDYILALEPGNCLPEGRVAARNNGRLQMLMPNQSANFTISFRIAFK
jgi:hypothetical protein